MQDRFKFRFFDKKENFLIDENTDLDKCIKLYGKDEWWWCAEHGLTTVLDYFDHYSYIQSRDFVNMQCSGLKDKNGKLIYEGDIVKIHNDVTAKIIFDKGCFSFTDGVYNQACYWKKDSLEVIGNIWETPNF